MFTLSVIIPAAGSGIRMKSDLPKPFIKLHQKTILEHTVEVFRNMDQVRSIIIACPQENLSQVRNLFPVNSFPEVHCVCGGAERQNSISNALQLVGNVDMVAIHDAVRPFIMKKNIVECCEAALETGAAILAERARDTVKLTNESGFITSTLKRDTVWLAQTPQIFKADIIKKAYSLALKSDAIFTDDASIAEHAGYPVKIVQGDSRNFKITYPDDIQRATAMIKTQWQK